MMQWETIATIDDTFRIVKMKDMVWIELGRSDKAEVADAPKWIANLYECLSAGQIETESVKQFKKMLLDAKFNDGTKELLKMCDILSTANEKGWFK